jgi:hydrogenase expression/formation protein HypE
MRLEEALMIYTPESQAVCGHLGIDPLKIISEGSLIITCHQASSKIIIAGLKDRNIESSVIGKVTDQKGERIIKRLDGRDEDLAVPSVDEFWPVFFRALQG